MCVCVFIYKKSEEGENEVREKDGGSHSRSHVPIASAREFLSK